MVGSSDVSCQLRRVESAKDAGVERIELPVTGLESVGLPLTDTPKIGPTSVGNSGPLTLNTQRELVRAPCRIRTCGHQLRGLVLCPLS